MKIKSKILLLCIMFLVIAFSGCTSEKQDMDSFVKSIPEVQQFMGEHPNSKISVVYWTKQEVADNLDEINLQCGRTIVPRALYKTTVSDGDNTIVGWIDAEKQIAISAISAPILTSAKTIPKPTSTSTATTPRLPSTSTTTPTPTPTPTIIPRTTSTDTSTPINSSVPTIEPQEYLVRIQGYYFLPTGSIKINSGDSIKFRNFESTKQPKTLVSSDGIWEEEQYLTYMAYVSYTFNESGVYTFYLKGKEDQKFSVVVN